MMFEKFSIKIILITNNEPDNMSKFEIKNTDDFLQSPLVIINYPVLKVPLPLFSITT